MKCNNCKAEWNVSAAMSASIKTCPFCGADLAPKVDGEVTSLQDVLKAIIAHGGLNSLRNGGRSLAMFSDLAPKLRKEKTLFSYLVQCEGNVILLDVLNKTRPEQLAARGKLMQRMVDDLLLSESVARQACDSFWEAVGGKAFEELTSSPKSEKPVITPQKLPVQQHKACPSTNSKVASPNKPAILEKISAKQCLAIGSRIHNRMIASTAKTLIGLDTKGNVHIAGNVSDDLIGVSNWTNIISVAAGLYGHVVGLKSDGSVCAAGNNGSGQCNVSNWTNIVSISAGSAATVGLRADGTVVYTGSNDFGQQACMQWHDIVAVSAGLYHILGLKANGTVVAVGKNTYGQCNVGNWKQITQIAAFHDHSLGLKQDQTVVTTGDNQFGCCKLTQWKNVSYVDTGHIHSVALTSSGSILAEGFDSKGRCNIKTWDNILTLHAGEDFTVGLSTDGKVRVAGQQWKTVDSWVLFDSIDALEKWLDFADQQKKMLIEKARREVLFLRQHLVNALDSLRMKRKRALENEAESLRREMSTLSLFFGGKRRKEIETRLYEIEIALKS